MNILKCSLVAVSLLYVPSLVFGQTKGDDKVAPATHKADKKKVQARQSTKTVRHHKRAHKPMANVCTPREQTIILDEDNGATEIEIVNNRIYVNGDLRSVIQDPNTESHRIHIDLKGKKETPEMTPVYSAPPKELNYDKDEAGFPSKKLMLGVFTSPNWDDDGARIRSIIPNSPADFAGIEAGDVIQRVNSTVIKSATDLEVALADHNEGETISVVYKRYGHLEYAEVELAGIKPKRDIASYEFKDVPDENGDMTLPPKFMHPYRHYYSDYYFEYTPVMGVDCHDAHEGKGVYVDAVKKESPGDIAGLKKGDIITWLDHIRIHTVDDLHYVLSNSWPDKKMKLVIRRDGQTMTSHVYLSKIHPKKEL